MRIATSQLYASNVQTMDDQQSQLMQLTQQLSSGVAISTAADNPLGAAQAVQLSATGATLSQYASNQNTGLATLQLEDTTLQSVGTVLQSVNQKLQAATNGSLDDSDRSALAQELTGLRNQLMTLANTTDGTGNYLFGGFQAGAAPFSNAPGGGATYTGDGGQRLVQVSGSRQIAVSDNGASVFQSVPAIGTSPVPYGSTTPPNTGTGNIGAVTVSDPTDPSNADTYSIQFTSGTTYNVVDSTTGNTVVNGATYADGQPIQLSTGMSVTITGAPASGDSFGVSSPTNAGTDVFQSISNAIAALQSPVSGSTAGLANLNNAMATAQIQIGNALTNVTTTLASVGGRESELKALQTVTSTNQTQNTSNLEDLTSIDYVSTISQYEQLQNALSAAQKSFVQTQGLSLFQYINP